MPQPMLAQLVDDVVATKFVLDQPRMIIGRHPGSDIQINEIAVSGQHAILEVEQNAFLEDVVDVYISDNNSTNGTYVNDLPVKGRQRLNNNDIVRIAWHTFQFIEDINGELEKTAYTLDS